jgi:hypothetical protein
MVGGSAEGCVNGGIAQVYGKPVGIGRTLLLDTGF